MNLKDYIQADKSLKGNNEYVDWNIFDERISLDGDFTVEELEEIIEHVIKYRLKSEKHEDFI